jgi:NADH dehydrogenase
VRALAALPPLSTSPSSTGNYHLFQPLLYQVATAGLSPAQIASPIRAILRRAANVRVVLGRVSGIDKERRLVTVDQSMIAYDHLVLATGARHSYFGRDDWESAAPGLKKIDDAIGIRRRLLTAFEDAESASSSELRRRLLTFIVIGGGPTGVEMAAAVAELARVALRRDFRNIDPADACVVLVEAGKRLLPTFPAILGDAACEALQQLGVEVRLGAAITQCDGEGVTIGEERLAAATIVWGAGVMASAAAQWLGVAKDRAGRVVVGPDLTVAGYPEISCIGDTACAVGAAGKPLPGPAPVAKQQGACVARRLRAAISGKAAPRPFRYRGCRPGMGEARRHPGVAVVERGPRLVPDRFPEPAGRHARLAVVLFHLPVRRPSHHRTGVALIPQPRRCRSLAGISVRLARILCCWSSLAASLGCSASSASASFVSSQNHVLRVAGVPVPGKADAASR